MQGPGRGAAFRRPANDEHRVVPWPRTVEVLALRSGPDPPVLEHGLGTPVALDPLRVATALSPCAQTAASISGRNSGSAAPTPSTSRTSTPAGTRSAPSRPFLGHAGGTHRTARPDGTDGRRGPPGDGPSRTSARATRRRPCAPLRAGIRHIRARRREGRRRSTSRIRSGLRSPRRHDPHQTRCQPAWRRRRRRARAPTGRGTAHRRAGSRSYIPLRRTRYSSVPVEDSVHRVRTWPMWRATRASRPSRSPASARSIISMCSTTDRCSLPDRASSLMP